MGVTSSGAAVVVTCKFCTRPFISSVAPIAEVADWPRRYRSLRTKDGHQTQDGWILGLAGRISHLVRLGTVPYQTGDGTYGEGDVKEADA